jgi:hypothetical protein
VKYLLSLKYSTSSRGVVVITSALHAEGHRFDPGQEQFLTKLFLKNRGFFYFILFMYRGQKVYLEYGFTLYGSVTNVYRVQKTSVCKFVVFVQTVRAPIPCVYIGGRLFTYNCHKSAKNCALVEKRPWGTRHVLY